MAQVDAFKRQAVALGFVAGLFILAWALADVAVLIFGGIVLAIVLNAMARGVSRLTALPDAIALSLVVIGLLASFGLFTWLLGQQASQQINELRTSLPDAIDAASRWLQEDSPVAMTLTDIWENASEGGVPWMSVAPYASIVTGAMLNLVLIGFIGMYIAASPGVYLQGSLKLVPDDLRERVATAFRAAGRGVEKWLLAQSVSMAAIGTLTMIGLVALGAPLAVPLGVLSGIMAFVPFFGALVSGFLAVLMAFTDSPGMALYVGLVCFGVQQVESYLITPFVQRWAVELPPVLGLLAVVIFGLLFGFMGVLLATPMMVVLMILVDTLYVEGVPSSGSAAEVD